VERRAPTEFASLSEVEEVRLDYGPVTVYSLRTDVGTGLPAKQGDLCMPWADGIRESRMREIRLSGLKRAEEVRIAWHADIEPRTGKPRNRCMPKPKRRRPLRYSTNPWQGVFLRLVERLHGRRLC
jgi:hypothetical protein